MKNQSTLTLFPSWLCITLISLIGLQLFAMHSVHAQSPQWLMPLYITDANMDRDTIYLGYDPEAGRDGEDMDTALGETWIQVDTSEFQVYFWIYPGVSGLSPLGGEPIRKIDIRSSLGWDIAVGFHKGKMPITIKWVDSLFYSPDLPFRDISPRPRARIDVRCSQLEPGYSNCDPIDCLPCFRSLTDYPAEEIREPVFDSLYFDGSGVFYTPRRSFRLFISLQPHDYIYPNPNLDVIRNTEQENFTVYPLPFQDVISVENSNKRNVTIVLYTQEGELLYSSVTSDEDIKINADFLPKGVYILSIIMANEIITKKLIKI